MKGRYWYKILVALVLALALGAWLGPYALSFYHLEAGGQALEAALEPVFPDRLAPEQVVDAERLQAGVAHLHQAIRWDPRNVQAMRLLVRVYITQGQPETALEMLQQALEVRPDNPLLYLELGDVYDSLGQTEAAIEAYEKGGVGSRGVPLAVNYLKLADARVQAGSGDVAIDLWRKVAIVDPGNLYALYRLTQIHRDMGDEEHAAEYEERLRHFDLQSVTVPLDSRLAEYQGRAMVGLVDDGVWERETLLNVVSHQVEQSADGVSGSMTERVLQTLLGRWPEDADIIFYLAELYHRRGDLERAEAAYRQVLEVEPGYAQAYLRIGMLYDEWAEGETGQ
ncbi:MAG: tetratricopeptide repeat protein [Anaerolineae bacterium]